MQTTINIPIHPRSVKGNFRNFKTAVLLLAYVVYFGLPWLPYARHDAPGQAVLFDLAGGRFFIFGLVIYPQDLISLAMLMFIAAALLFFVTGLVGRAFCGYFCFQTLWTDAFIFIEKWIQGDRPARIRLATQPWNLEKVLKLGVTHTLWLCLSFATGLAFILYFGETGEVFKRFFIGTLPHQAYITVLTIVLCTYVAAGLARETVCHLCPYSRFQGAMYDPETRVPYYDFRRGEGEAGRSLLRSGQKSLTERYAQGIGECIDCGNCVQVCPSGIDIRDGLQSQCVTCGLCVDACNTIMESVGFPQGLIRYDSESRIVGVKTSEAKLAILRPRTLGYGAAILVMTGMQTYSLATRDEVQLLIQPVRQPLFVVLSDGDIRNRYQIHITNKSGEEKRFHVAAPGLPERALDKDELGDVKVRPGKSVIMLVNVRLSPAEAQKTDKFDFVLINHAKPEAPSVRRVNFYARSASI